MFFYKFIILFLLHFFLLGKQDCEALLHTNNVSPVRFAQKKKKLTKTFETK